jgi:predicted glutamine amidotransferase
VIAGARRVNAGDSAELSGVQPLEHGRHLFAFAGKLQSFHEVFARPLEKALGDEAARTLRGTSEAELLFATWIDALGNRSGEDAMADALDRMVTRVRQIGGKSARAALAVICSDGHSLVTLRTATLGAPPPLVTTVAGDGAPVPRTGRLIAAEPLYGSGWSEVEPHSLTIFAVEG